MKSKDPICGMTVDSERAAARGVYAEGTVYFCSTACQKRYEQQQPPAR
ncbi:MAG: YHS domain-containing protein [Thermoplasmata archaeon]